MPKTEDLVKSLQEIHDQLRAHLVQAFKAQEHFANQYRLETPLIEPGDPVWLDAKNITSTRPCRKLDSKRVGPFEVKGEINPSSYELNLPPWMKIHPVFHVSLLEKAKTNELPNRHQPNPPPVLVNGQEEYLVHEILDSRIRHNHLQYLIDWEGYPPSERCWVDAVEVHAAGKVRQYHLKYPTKPHPWDLTRRGDSEGGVMSGSGLIFDLP